MPAPKCETFNTTSWSDLLIIFIMYFFPAISNRLISLPVIMPLSTCMVTLSVVGLGYILTEALSLRDSVSVFIASLVPAAVIPLHCGDIEDATALSVTLIPH